MMIDYGISVQGKSHIAKGVCCQDNYRIKELSNGWYIAAVADGVGSAANSHIGASIAVETAVEMCEELMPWDYSTIGIKSMLRTVYNYAFKQILRESKKTGEPIESYDTTLTMVIYDGHRIIYGHSGDGAIIGLNTFGEYIPITKPQKGEDHFSVIPLRAGHMRWEIDAYEDDLSAVLLMTDGMLEKMCPYLLLDHERGKTNPYVPLISIFADPALFGGDEEELSGIVDNLREFVTAPEDYDVDKYYRMLERVYKVRVPKQYQVLIKGISDNGFPITLVQDIQDDKTIVGLINLDSEFDSNEEEYYREPDWRQLQENWSRKAYPHLYTGDVNVSEYDNNALNESDSVTAEEENDKPGEEDTIPSECK